MNRIFLAALTLACATCCSAAFSQSGDVSNSTVTAPSGIARSLLDRFTDRASGLERMSKTVRGQVGAITNGSASGAYLNGVPSTLQPDVTSFLQAQLALGKPVDLPCGTYRITDQIVVPNYSELSGFSSGCVQILVGYKVVSGNKVPDFSSATSVVKLGIESKLRNVEIALAQPDVSTRAALVAYPRAVDVSTAPAHLLEDVLVSGAIDGIWCDGNCGASTWHNVKVGAVGIAFHVDGALAWLKVTAFDTFPFGFQTTNLLIPYNDGQGTCFEAGQVEALAIESMSCAASKVRIYRNASGGSSFGTIGIMNLDAVGSPLVMSAGQVSVGALYSSKAGTTTTTVDAVKTIVLSGGRLTIGSADLDMVGAVGPAGNPTFVDGVQVTGGLLTIGSGSIIQRRGEARAISVSGGKVVLGAVNIDSGNVNGFARTVPYVEQTGTGSVDLGTASFVRKANDDGLAVRFNTDNAGNRMEPAQLHGWGASITQRSIGSYGDGVLSLTLNGTGSGLVAHGFPTAGGTTGNLKLAVTAFATLPGQPAISVPIPAANIAVDPTSVNINGLGSSFNGATVYILARPTGL